MFLRTFYKTHFSENKDLYRSIKNIFGFYPENIYLYKLALRHKSATIKKINGLKMNNERLEFLGDALLSAIVAEFLFKKFPYKNEGFLTEMRSKIVSRTSLNKLSAKLGLTELILSGTDTNNQSKSASGDAFEAFLGALYLDKGFDFTRRILVNRIISIHFDMEQLIDEQVSYKSRMIEWAQKEKRDLQFELVEEIGEKQQKQYLVAVMVDGVSISQAQDYSIKGAEKLSAEKAYQLLEISES
ncbi:MAG TPA: ribonuclease III [Bacteroidales bacterium]